MLSISLWSLVSSAYNFTGEETPVDISLTYIIIKMGPKSVPWGTSDFTEVHNEWMPRKTTCCDRTIIKKLWNQLKRGPSIPHISYLWSRGLCGRLSNALGKSKRVMSVGRLLKMKKWSSQWMQFMELRKEAWKKKNSGLQRGLNPWPCDTGAMLYQLSYEATDVGSRSIVGLYVHVKEMSGNDMWNKSYMNCGNEMKMKKWSWQWTQFMQLRKEDWKKFRTSTGFEPVTSRYRWDALPTELWSHWRWEQVNWPTIDPQLTFCDVIEGARLSRSTRTSIEIFLWNHARCLCCFRL